MHELYSLFRLLVFTLASLHVYVVASRNDDIHLAVRPRCGSFSGNYTNVNAGLVARKFNTIVAFGDSYTDGGKSDGSTLSPPIVVPPNPEAGGRSTNGLTWIEHVANDIGATLKDYAQSGACIDLSLWPSNPKKVDFVGQMATFTNQSTELDPMATLYTVFFGINDYLASLVDGDHLQAAARVLIEQIDILASPPTNARSFMVADVYGRGISTPSGEAFKQKIFDSLREFQKIKHSKISVAYIDFATIWNGVLGPKPGYAAFGYSSPDACTTCTEQLGCTTVGMCSDPDHYFYWIPGHPSKQSMRIMADYVHEVLQTC